MPTTAPQQPSSLVLDIDGITCADCAARVEYALLAKHGVVSVKVGMGGCKTASCVNFNGCLTGIDPLYIVCSVELDLRDCYDKMSRGSAG